MEQNSQAKVRKIVLILCRFALGVIFLAAAYGKLRPLPGFSWSISSMKLSLATFAMGVDSYQILPPWAVSPMAHFLPFFEIALGVWLISGLGLRVSSLISTLILCVFIFAMFSAWRRGLTVDCKCFSQGGARIGLWDMIRDGLIFMPLALILLIASFVMNRKPRASSVA